MKIQEITTRRELKENIRRILVGTLINENEKVSDNLLDIIIKFYFSRENISEEENKFLEENYLRLIEKEKEKISKEIDINNIKALVSAFSFTQKNNLMEEFAFEKDMKVFPNIEKIYLLYTQETENKFKEYKKSCEYKEKIEGVEIDGRTVDETYKKIKDLVLKNKINKDNTVLDITLGMKTISIAFYRISVERQIKAINWNEKFLNNYEMKNKNEFIEKIDGKLPRIALSTKLSLMREPIKESLGIYSKINENILKGNYEVVSDFYKIIGIDDMAFFYKKLSKIFDIELIDSDEFYENLNIELNEIYNYNEFTNESKNKINNVVRYLLKILLYYCKDKIEKLSWYNFNKNEYKLNRRKTTVEKNTFEDELEEISRRRNSQKEEKEEKEEKKISRRRNSQKKEKFSKDELEENLKEYLKEYFEFLKVKYKVIRTKELLSDIADGLAIRLPENEVEINKIEEVEDRKIFLDKVFNKLFPDLTVEDIEKFEIEKYLIEKIDIKLSYKDGKLTIPNKGLEKYFLLVDIKNEKSISKIVKNPDTHIHKPILKLLEGINDNSYEVESEYVRELIFLGDRSEDKEDRKKVKTSDEQKKAAQNRKMRDLIDKLNEIIKEKMLKEKIELGNFIKYSDKRNKDYSIRISEEFIM